MLELSFVERELYHWYYILENNDAPKNAWSWIDYATAYGPFHSFASAKSHHNNAYGDQGEYDVLRTGHYKLIPEGKREPYEDLFKHAKI